MPLKINCVRCGTALVLHDAFAGAACRCRHCQTLLQVPAAAFAASAVRAASRPARPRLAAEFGRVATKTSHSAATAVGKAAAAKTAAAGVRIVSFTKTLWISATTAAVLFVSFGTVAGVRHFRFTHGSVPPTSVVTVSNAGVEAATDDDAVVVAGTEKLPPRREAMRTFVGTPLAPQRVAWVIDGGAEMAPYYSSISSLAKTAMMHMGRLGPEASYGLFVATPEGAPRIQSIDAASPQLYVATRNQLDGVSPGGRADLTQAVAAAARERPDLTFLVLARPLDSTEARDIRRQALAVGMKTHVIVLGKAGRAAATVASATSGQVAMLDQATLSAWRNLLASRRLLDLLEKEYVGK